MKVDVNFLTILSLIGKLGVIIEKGLNENGTLNIVGIIQGFIELLRLCDVDIAKLDDVQEVFYMVNKAMNDGVLTAQEVSQIFDQGAVAFGYDPIRFKIA